MTHLGFLTITAAVLSLPLPAPQAPAPIQNGRVETRPSTSLERDLPSLGNAPDPVWIAWRVPMVDGDRTSCSTWSSNNVVWYRGETLEPNPFGNTTPPVVTPPTGVSLESGTNLIVLARMIGGQVERLRSVDDSCPIDANGRTVFWLTGVTPADSIRYLDGLTRQDALNIDTRRRLAESAIEAIGLHKDLAADAVLDRLAASTDSPLRQRAASSLASLRGAHGFATLKRLLDTERDRNTRRSLASSLAQTRQPGTLDLMLSLARTDPDPDLRATAISSYALRAGQAGVANVLAVVEKDTADQVKQRAVSGLGRLPADVSVPTLINLARTNASPAVRKQAVSSLGQIRDPRAAAYLAEILAK